jgi:hypothetical protein
MARQYVTYEQVKKGLHRPWCRWNSFYGVGECEPQFYLNALRHETGLSWAKLAHDLSVDSGYPVSEANVRRWAK